MALIFRNGGSQSPDRWLRELRNNHNVKTLCLSQLKRGCLTEDNAECNAISTTKLSVLEEIVDLIMAEKKKLVVIARVVAEINNIQEIWEKKGIGYAVVKIIILAIYVWTHMLK